MLPLQRNSRKISKYNRETPCATVPGDATIPKQSTPPMTRRNLTNIPPGSTTCSVCNTLKDNTEFSFYKDRLTNNGYRLMVNTNCRDCSKMRSKERSAIKKKFKDLVAPKFGTPCECCGKPVTRNWQLDHDHETGEFRGWLCKQCNTGLGNLGDTLESIEKAKAYLIRARSNSNLSQQSLINTVSNDK